MANLRKSPRLPLRLAILCTSALSALALAGCDVTGPPLPATFEGTWAGRAWRGEAYATLRQDTLYLSGTSPVGASAMPQTHLHVHIAPTGAGTYTLDAGQAAFHYLVGGDVRTASYASTAGSGTLVIEHISDTRVRGTLVFEAVRAYGHAPAGAGARFEGSFDATLGRIF
jgi:hypothetical protein